MNTQILTFLLLVGTGLMSNAQTAVQPLAGNINTANDETAPFQYGGRIYFTSIYKQHFDAGAVQRIFSTNGVDLMQTNFNPHHAEAHAADLTLSSDAKRMFYTIRKGESCAIWYRNRNYEGDWAAAKKLPSHINQRGYSSAQPSVGYDKILQKDVLYFSSSRPGGKGGMDIWGSVIEPVIETGEIRFGQPFLLPFNTAQDEVTPFFHMASQTMFFSSDGLQGEGGKDIFWLKKDNDGTWQAPINPGPALNSASDDMYYTFHTSSQKGYFASNRGEGGDFNLYTATPSLELHIAAFDIHNEEPVNGISLEVFDEEEGRSTVFQQQPFDINLLALLPAERSYRIAIIADGYSPQLLMLSAEQMNVPMTSLQEVHLFRDDFNPASNRESPGVIFPREQPVQISHKIEAFEK